MLVQRDTPVRLPSPEWRLRLSALNTEVKNLGRAAPSERDAAVAGATAHTSPRPRPKGRCATSLDDYRTGTTSNHLPALDGVRGLAVLIVILHNAGWIAGSSEQLIVKLFTAVTATGWIGVSLFFALSGLLITGVLLDTRGRSDFFRSFYLRRTLRIFPLYYAYVAGVVLVATPLAWSASWAADVRAGQWPYWLYVSNWTQTFGHGIFGMTHLWSLAVEEQFYLIWPPIAYALGRSGLAKLACVMVLAGPGVRYLLSVSSLPTEATYLFTIARWDALAAGALLAAMLRHERGQVLVTAVRGKIGVVLLSTMAILLLKVRGFHSDDRTIAVFGQSIIVGLCFAFLAYVVVDRGATASRLQQMFTWSGLRTLGKYSYAMYLFHFPIHHLLKVPLGPWVVGSDDSLRIVRVLAYLALIFLLTFSAALISWRVIEKPFLDLKDRFAPRPDGIRPAITISRAAPQADSHAAP